MTKNNTVTSMKPDELHFDWKNPRMAEFGITQNTSDNFILRILWDAMDVRELIMSISASGFFSTNH